MSGRSAKEKAEAGMFLSLRELAAVTGIGQNRIRAIAKRPGFPFFEKKVRLVDFETWYRHEAGIAPPFQAPVADAQPQTNQLSRIERLSPKRLTSLRENLP